MDYESSRDISKGKSQVQAFLDKGKPSRKSFSIKHTLDGLDSLLEFLREIEKLADGKQTSVILESTGQYHMPVIQFLEEQQYIYIIVNPLISHRARSTNLRKVKTDAIDAYQLCELYYKEELELSLRILALRGNTHPSNYLSILSYTTMK